MNNKPKMGRRPISGVKLRPLMVSVTAEQLAWLRKQPNISELVRRLIQAEMDARDAAKERAREVLE